MHYVLVLGWNMDVFYIRTNIFRGNFVNAPGMFQIDDCKNLGVARPKLNSLSPISVVGTKCRVSLNVLRFYKSRTCFRTHYVLLIRLNLLS